MEYGLGIDHNIHDSAMLLAQRHTDTSRLCGFLSCLALSHEEHNYIYTYTCLVAGSTVAEATTANLIFLPDPIRYDDSSTTHYPILTWPRHPAASTFSRTACSWRMAPVTSVLDCSRMLHRSLVTKK